MRYKKSKYRVFFLLFILLGTNIAFGEDNYDDIDEYEAEYSVVIKDPFEKFNRKILTFNMFFLDNVAKPLSKAYKAVTNQFIRDRLSNFGSRFSDPIILINSLLQFDLKNSAKTVGTFGINMTIGLFGLFNPAKHFGLYRENKKFGETLAFYGVGNGFYLMLPFLGPTTLRNGVGQIAEFYLDPFFFNKLNIIDKGDLTPDKLTIPKFVGQYAEQVGLSSDLSEKFLKKAFDPYIFLRESYLQRELKKNK
ncbi:MAG: VacJ family lipoprotein [Rickettsiales bacterium]|jgi:phospholipid-binding lipoprotein MlaA|nr:VacJ family lipoprotein [Rickettsiales bacterium]